MPDGGSSEKPKSINSLRREIRVANHAHKYALVLQKDAVCVYCGAAVKTGQVDHVPPLSWAARAWPNTRFLLYSACAVCNSKLSSYPGHCLKERAGVLAQALRREYRLLKGGEPRRYSLAKIVATGKMVVLRLSSGDVARCCSCSKCRDTVTFRAVQSGRFPYAGKDDAQGKADETMFYQPSRNETVAGDLEHGEVAEGGLDGLFGPTPCPSGADCGGDGGLDRSGPTPSTQASGGASLPRL